MVQTQHKKPAKAFFRVIVFSFLLYYAMTTLQPYLGTYLFDYNTWEREMVTNPGYRFLWTIGDATEPFFHKALLGGVGVFIGLVIAYVLDRKHSRYRGTPISYGQGRIYPTNVVRRKDLLCMRTPLWYELTVQKNSPVMKLFKK